MGKIILLSGKPFVKRLFIVVFPLLIAGCAPPAVQIVSWVVDGLLYATTGKSASDHIISVAVKKDCAMWRVVKGAEICSDIAPATSDGIMVAMGDDETLSQDDLDAIAEHLSAIETAAGDGMTSESSQIPKYRGVQTANFSFGRTLLSPRKKNYELSAGVAATTGTDTVDGFPAQTARESVAKSADGTRGGRVPPIIAAVMPFGQPVTLADGFIRSPRKRNRFMPLSIPKIMPFGRPVHTDFSRLPGSVVDPTDKLVPERAKLLGVDTSFRDSSDNGMRQLAALSAADDSLFPVAGITGKKLAVSPKAVTAAPAVESLPAPTSRYLVLGSFRNRDNARAFSGKLVAFDSFIVTAQLRGGAYHRVLARPSSGENLEGLKSRYSQATGAESWVVTLSEPIASSKTAALR